jgi:hypothetical protein
VKRFFVIFIALMVVATLAVPIAVTAAPAGKDTPANDNLQNLYLYPKNSNWSVIWDGAWGKYNYKLSGTEIFGVFNGHGLVPGTNYTLVEYNNWPSITIIGSGVADKAGNVHIVGAAGLGTPTTWDGDYTGLPAGYKIWLVLTDDITNSALNKWNPAPYLFEHNLIYGSSVNPPSPN